MGVRIRIRGTNRIPQLVQSIRELKDFEIEIGIFGSDDSFYAMIAAVHEFGITIRKERGSIVIPERSFLRSTFDEKNSEWAKFVKKQLPKLLDGQMNARTICERLGAKMVGDIQRKLTQLDDPPNAPSTVAQKGSSNPLIDKGGLRQRITYKVVTR
ncbi:hypothetical protein M5J14_23315 [Lysinibacillus sp. OL1_EC]|uniref:hypothetical protein n=1 Tax=unclassified Lysinibacillus TaxID=2636778 RepID=UPI001D10178B|nr:MULTISPECIES: hypothetical protein [unclassified Lysinibacillus]MCM0627413.1 hypothetical protein [Lysinibacillus sp. OL1_EC]